MFKCVQVNRGPEVILEHGYFADDDAEIIAKFLADIEKNASWLICDDPTVQPADYYSFVAGLFWSNDYLNEDLCITFEV